MCVSVSVCMCVCVSVCMYVCVSGDGGLGERENYFIIYYLT